MAKSFTGSIASDQALAGFSAGAVSTIALHPFDLVKTRFQIDESSRRHSLKPPTNTTSKTLLNFRTFTELSKIYHSEGGIRGLYRGLSPNFVGATLSWGLYFWWYQLIKDKMRGESNEKLSASKHLLASAEAGMVTCLFTNPFWLIKTRMCAQKATDPGAYRGLIDGLYQTWKFEGFRGLYRGLIPALFGTSHGALQFMAYEEMKHFRAQTYPNKDVNKLNTGEYIVMAATSKIFAASVTYPYQVIKARLQNERSLTNSEYNTILGTIRKIYTSEGLLAFYKGIGPNIIRVLPGTCITFVVYETLSKAFRTFGDRNDRTIRNTATLNSAAK